MVDPVLGLAVPVCAGELLDGQQHVIGTAEGRAAAGKAGHIGGNGHGHLPFSIGESWKSQSTMGKSWGNHGEIMGESWGNHEDIEEVPAHYV